MSKQMQLSYREDCNIQPKPRYMRLVRKAKGLSQYRLAMRCEIPAPYLAQIESGRKFPYPLELQKIADELEVDDATELLQRIDFENEMPVGLSETQNEYVPIE